MDAEAMSSIHELALTTWYKSLNMMRGLKELLQVCLLAFQGHFYFTTPLLQQCSGAVMSL
jgi:hypothetical protein